MAHSELGERIWRCCLAAVDRSLFNRTADAERWTGCVTDASSALHARSALPGMHHLVSASARANPPSAPPI
jgi:hypothetical protein